jgi:hypothetical protein
MNGLSLTYLPDQRSQSISFSNSWLLAFQSDENERFDIIGRYSLRQIESNLGSDNFGEVLAELGNGTQHQYVRNSLDIEALHNAELKGGLELQQMYNDAKKSDHSHFLQWSLKYQNEDIEDRINEWERLDSAGYSLPYDTSQVLLYNVLKTRNTLNFQSLQCFFSGYIHRAPRRPGRVAHLAGSCGLRTGI